MVKKLFKYTLIGLFAITLLSFKNIFCEVSSTENQNDEIITAAEQPELYVPLLKGKKVGVVTNQTGIVLIKKDTLTDEKDTISVVDFLLNNEINISKIFSPEHGFRGTADAGETIKSGRDSKTNLPIISLYGNNKKPTKEQLADLDAIVFDLQDVGVRFYTYISTLHYVMEAAAENNIPLILFDRPNPNAHYIDGPILEKSQQSFVGMHPVPIVYGMTIGEYAQMINGEKWLKNEVQCELTVIPLKNYTHQSEYSLPVKPSPNLPNDTSINLYPSTCFFEGINASEGRGTDKQFQVYGSPYFKNMPYEFIPSPNEGAKNPRFSGQICYGEDLTNTPKLNEIELKWLIKAYENYTGKSSFFIKNSGSFWLDKLAGTPELRKQIEKGWTQEQIKETWRKDLENFNLIRQKYLIYD